MILKEHYKNLCELFGSANYQYYLQLWDTFHIAKWYATEQLLSETENQLGKKPSKILEFGSGVGGTTRHMLKKWPEAEIKTIELIKESLNYNEEKTDSPNVTYINSSVLDMDKHLNPDEKFDVVISEECMCHIPHHHSLIKMINKRLERGGIFGFTDWMKSERLTQEEIDKITEDWVLAKLDSRESYGKILENSGFSVLFSENKSVEWTEKDDEITESHGEKPLQIFEDLLSLNKETIKMLKEDIYDYIETKKIEIPTDPILKERFITEQICDLIKVYLKTDYALYLIYQDKLQVSMIVSRKR